LAQLDGCLQEMLSGEGKVVFLEGGPGRGKTALLEAFARSAIATHPDLLVFSGDGNAHTGIGDPYLLFREALSMLSGDVEAKWAAGSISTEHARRLWEICPFTAQSLVNYGPDLVEVFVSGKGLLARISAAVPDQRGLLQALRALADKTGSGSGDLEQKALFEQYTQVLIQIAERHPLVLVLDDLQWADTASINLLFHLGRCLGGHRILVVGAYRAEEITLGRGDDRHPMERVLNEFKRFYGDICIDLSQELKEEERRFIDALLDYEPNRLGEEFREALYAHTGGHPLFTIELLRNLQERGDLVLDENGSWLEGSHLDWSILPPKVEGVIEERIGRLEDELRELLAVASVEGEDFTAQVVAQVEEANERRLLRQLSGELEKRHRLVHARGEQVVGEHTLSRYRFTHALFQQFLYNDLSPGERRLLHKEIAQVLEGIHAGSLDKIYLQLAHHYSQANEGEKAIHYLLLVGDQARNNYAHQEAIDTYLRALSFQEKLGDYGGAARTQMKLGQTYHSAFDYQRANASYTEGFSLWQRASERQSVEPLTLSSQAFRSILRWDPFTLDPGLINDMDSCMIIGHIFRGLLELTPEMDVVPDLALRWQIQEGGCKYVFHIRTDSHWSDGAPVTAHDFVYAWRRLLNPANQSNAADLLYDIKGARAYHLGLTSKMETLGIRASTPYTLEVELETPTGYFLHLMACPSTFPIPRHVVERWGESWTDIGNLVVNGPFLIESWKPGKSLTLVRNPEYLCRFSGNLQRAKIGFLSPSEWSDQISMYEGNKLDVLQISYFQSAEINHLRHQYLAEHLSAPLLDIFFLEFNTARAPFDDLRVRRAFMLSLDREALTHTTAGSAIIPALGGLIPPGIPGHAPEIGHVYNPEEARELLAQAGYPGGRGFPPVEVLLWPGAEVPLAKAMARWQDILGVKHVWEFASIIDVPERAKVKPPHMSLQGWAADYPDPDNFLRVGFQKELTGWQGELFDELVERARSIQDQAERIRLYRQADKILVDEAIVLPLAYLVGHFLVKPWVKNFPLSPMGTWFLKDVVIEPH
jgi:ABC-type oligopeptide transport system substrate-binding subunit